MTMVVGVVMLRGYDSDGDDSGDGVDGAGMGVR